MRIVNLPITFVKLSIRSKQSLFLAVAVVSVMATLLAVSIFVAKRSSAHGVNSAKKKQQGCCADQPAILRRMIATYYTTEDGFKSTLILNNKGPNQIMVTPILHSRNGQTFTASPVAVGGLSSPEVDLNVLASIAGPQFRSGSFEFTYEGRLLEVGGGLRIVDSAKSLIFDEQMLEPGMKFPSPRLEAVYAVPFEDSQVSVIMTNTAAQPVNVDGDAIFAGANGRHPVKGNLGPYETKIVDLPRGLVKKASAGAVSLSHNGAAGALLAMIHLQDADRGYSEAVSFTNPSGKTTERHGAGLRLGSVNNDLLRPVIAVRNLGDSATTVTATVPYSKQNGDTGTIALPQISLAPGEIKLLNTSNPQLRRNDFATAGLEIKYTGAPGSLIATATSVSQSGNHVFALPMKDPQGGLSSTGGYPWFISESSSTVVFIKNVTNAPREFMLDIAYPGGHWGSNVRTITPGQTFMLDVRKVRDSQERGAEGDVMPLDVTSGHVSWSYRGNQNKVLIGRAQMVDFSNGLASTYECQCICGWVWAEARLLPGSVSGSPGDVTAFTPQSRYTNCLGYDMGWQGVPGYSSVTYSSDNSSVASISSSGVGTALAPGSTYLRASWTEYWDRQEYQFSEWVCVAVAAAAACATFCEVKPSITVSDASKFWYFNGVHPDATNYPTAKFLTANPGGAVPRTWTVTAGSNKANFGGSAQLNNETYNPVTLNSAGRSTDPNDVTVTVTVNGVTSNPVNFTVKAPHSLDMNASIADTSDITFGYVSYIVYTIKDWQGNNLPANIGVNEKWATSVTPDYTNTNWTRGNEMNGNSVGAGFQDAISGNCIACPPAAFPAPISPCEPSRCNVPVIHWGQDFYIGSTTSGIGRKVQTGTLQLYTDHGRCNGRQSPVPGT